jgi:hypothetical protein
MDIREARPELLKLFGGEDNDDFLELMGEN